MTRAQAEARCTVLNGAGGLSSDERWLPRRTGEDGWEPVRVRVPGLSASGPLTTTAESRPRPPYAPDPRSGPLRDVPPYGGGV
jgi:hypothetical protein